jgi:hypothetical protein
MIRKPVGLGQGLGAVAFGKAVLERGLPRHFRGHDAFVLARLCWLVA